MPLWLFERGFFEMGSATSSMLGLRERFRVLVSPCSSSSAASAYQTLCQMTQCLQGGPPYPILHRPSWVYLELCSCLHRLVVAVGYRSIHAHDPVLSKQVSVTRIFLGKQLRLLSTHRINNLIAKWGLATQNVVISIACALHSLATFIAVRVSL